jgi:DNA-binding MarR family transcriptional regulator
MSLRKTYLALRGEGARLLTRLRLSHSEYVALEVCARRSAHASDIAEAIGITSAGATNLIDRLERRRLVHRREDSHDRRVVLVELTLAGEQLFRQAQLAYRAMLHHLGKMMSDRERGALLEGLAALDRALSREVG